MIIPKDFNEILQRLFDSFCERHSFTALKYLLEGWPIYNGDPEEHEALLNALRSLRKYAEVELTDKEISEIDDTLIPTTKILLEQSISRHGMEVAGKLTPNAETNRVLSLKERYVIQEISPKIEELLKACCDRRNFKALCYLSGIWPLSSIGVSGWDGVVKVLSGLRSMAIGELTEAELYTIDALIIRIQKEFDTGMEK